MEQQNLEKIKKIAEEYFEKMGFEIEIEVLPEKEQTIPLRLKATDARILIGERGQTLFEIQHLLKAILRREIKEDFYLDLDINDYKKNKILYLKDLARSAAEEAVLTKRERELPPMSAAERRIIHLELALRKDIRTQSIGREPERRVVIQPYS